MGMECEGPGWRHYVGGVLGGTNGKGGNISGSNRNLALRSLQESGRMAPSKKC